MQWTESVAWGARLGGMGLHGSACWHGVRTEPLSSWAAGARPVAKQLDRVRGLVLVLITAWRGRAEMVVCVPSHQLTDALAAHAQRVPCPCLPSRQALPCGMVRWFCRTTSRRHPPWPGPRTAPSRTGKDDAPLLSLRPQQLRIARCVTPFACSCRQIATRGQNAL